MMNDNDTINTTNYFKQLPVDCVAMSENIDQFCAAFLKAQAEIFNIRHKYTNIDMVLEEVLPILKENNLSIFQPPIFNGEDRLQTILMHKSGQFISFGSIKIIHERERGITSTQLYALISILGLSQEDEESNYTHKKYESNQFENNTLENKPFEQKEMITESQINTIKGKIRERCDTSEEMQVMKQQILNSTKKSSFDKLTKKQYYFVMAKFLK